MGLSVKEDISIPIAMQTNPQRKNPRYPQIRLDHITAPPVAIVNNGKNIVRTSIIKNTVVTARNLAITIWNTLSGLEMRSTSVPHFLSSAKVLIVSAGIRNIKR